MRRNVASQIIGAQMVSATDGSAFTDTVTLQITVDGGTQTASAGTGPTHEGNGFHSYITTAGETNGSHVAFTFLGTGAVPATVQVYPMAYSATGVSDANATQLAGQTVTAAAGVTFPTSIASPTNITAGTITTVTTVTGLTAANLDVAVSTRMATYTQPTGFLAATFPASPAAVGDIPTATQNADALLNRDMSAVSDTNARSPLNALRFLRNKWSISGTTLTVTKEDDTTSGWTAVVTAAPGADPISGNDPT